MNIQEMIKDYTDWLKQEISFSKVGDFYEINVPYLNSSNDYLQIYVTIDQDNVVHLSDDCDTINNLMENGFQLTASRRTQLKNILRQFGVQLSGNELVAKAPLSQFPQKKHMFVQAMLRVDDMYMITQTRVKSYFLDDIVSFFEEKEIYYTEDVQFTGKSGFQHKYDFLLQRSKEKPERLCQAINKPTKTNMMNTLFAWSDIKTTRREDSKLIVILNDKNIIQKGVTEGFTAYDIDIIKWSEHNNENYINILSA
jgi:hypothetical protein|nr:MAG TPA: protein of unknown function DUF1829 [Bacteriophage sp.]